MAYKITIYKATGEKVQIAEVPKTPTLAQLQEAVGGLIEQVPEPYYRETNLWFGEQHPYELDAVWCNEEGLMHDEPVANKFFEPAPWGDRLYGDIAVVEKVK